MKYRYLIYTLFFASGISGLMYEVVWLRMLSRITGVTIYATATVVAAYMAGLALGSFALGRFIDKRNDPLRVYAALELLVAIAALLVPFFFSASVPLYRYVYEASGESTAAVATVRAVVSFLSVLIPTTLMGGTLPVLTSCLVRRDQLFGQNFSKLYGLNTLGAVCGVLLSGFVTIGALGEENTVYIGVAINVLVAGMAYLIFRLDPVFREDAAMPAPAAAQQDVRISPYSDTIRRVVLVAFVISGFTALAYEVIWTRQLVLFLTTAIYSFSGMLAIFLLGIALGSMYANRMVDRVKSPLGVFGFLELLVGALTIANLYAFFPPTASWARGALGEAVPIAATLTTIFLITFVLGIIFPIAGLCYAKNVGRTGSAVGWLYGANTLGSILGSLVAGFLLIPLWGSTNTILFLAGINAALGIVLVALEPGRPLFKKLVLVPVAIVFGLVIYGSLGIDPFLAVMERKVFGPDWATVAKKDFAQQGTEIYSHREGLQGTVTSFSRKHVKRLYINGAGMTHPCTEVKLMTHLPLMFAKDPKEILVICFGIGTTVKSAAIYPNMNTTAVELVAEVFDDFPYFHPDSPGLLSNPKIKLVNNDGRNYLLFTHRKYDVITVDPAPPIWAAGTVNLYTREFFELCRDHLNPGGAMCLWFPGGTKAENLSIIRTFAAVFPEFSIWNGPNSWGFYCIGTLREVPREEIRQTAEKVFSDSRVLTDLEEYDRSCATPQQLDDLFSMDKKRIGEIEKDGILITDDNPYTEFFLWRYLLHEGGLAKITRILPWSH